MNGNLFAHQCVPRQWGAPGRYMPTGSENSFTPTDYTPDLSGFLR
ncbi:ferredoxin [Pseudomonas aeruginosa]|nr:ferredoxin [Pseudomonas aeruginosa]